MDHQPIIIAGGGICGLACALAAAQAGYSVLVVESAPKFEAIGAGLQLGPNAVQALKILGAWETVSPICGVPSALLMHDAVSGRLLRRMELGSRFEQRHGAPYRVAHRADLHEALVHCVRQSPAIEVHCGVNVAAFEQLSDGVCVTAQSGENYFGCGLIAADGIKSSLRTILRQVSKLCDSGLTIHRAPLLKNSTTDSDVHLWMGPGFHVVDYAVGKVVKQNLICVTKKDVQPSDIFSRLPPALHNRMANVPEWTEWPGLYLQPLQSWSNGNFMVLGDAAHGTLPFMAQGAAMALEDAAWLKQALQKSNSLAESFASHTARRKRTSRLHRASLRQGEMYHQKGIAAKARNFALGHMPEMLVHRQLAWLYQHNEQPMEV